MNMWKLAIPFTLALLCAGHVAAQTDEDGMVRGVAEREADVERRLMEAEKRMAEAAREMAELTSQRLPHMVRVERRAEITSRPRLGVTIDGDAADGPVEGVSVIAVSPGSAASDAGLRAGDVITSINDESFSAVNFAEANQKLLDFMAGVEEGDALDVEYLRNGKVGKVEVEAKVGEHHVFAWRGDGGPNFRFPEMPNMHSAPHLNEHFNLGYRFAGNGLGDMELVELSAGLGRYFGTDSGLLVVTAPESNKLGLQDGDVIQSIDGRVPNSVRHALQILSTYQAGEKLELEIMRDKRPRKLNIEMPDYRSGMLNRMFRGPVKPAAAPVPARVFATERS